MKKIGIIVLVVFFSCNRVFKEKFGCQYSIKNFYEELDTLKVDVKKQNEVVEVFDKPNIFGQRGMYQFDRQQNLRFYSFLLNNRNDAFFSVSYDSLGNEIGRTGNNVVQWYFKRKNNDSVEITFLLFCINYKYEKLVISKRNEIVKVDTLYKSSKFSNLKYNIVDFRLQKNNIKNGKSEYIYIHGKKMNSCNKIEIDFSDSIQIPDVLRIPVANKHSYPKNSNR